MPRKHVERRHREKTTRRDRLFGSQSGIPVLLPWKCVIHSGKTINWHFYSCLHYKSLNFKQFELFCFEWAFFGFTQTHFPHGFEHVRPFVVPDHDNIL